MRNATLSSVNHFGTSAGYVPEYPARVDRRAGAELISKLYFPLSPRTLERWPLPVRHVNGKAVYETDQLLAYAQSLLDAAPQIMSGKHRAAA